MITAFIWNNSLPRVPFKTLTKTREKVGLALPDLQIYYWAAQTNDAKVQRRKDAHCKFTYSVLLYVNVFC